MNEKDRLFLVAIAQALLELLNVEGMEKSYDALEKEIDEYDASPDEG